MKKNINNDLVNSLYSAFCESDYIDHPVQEAWDNCEKEFGLIRMDDKTDCIGNLFHQTIQYVVDSLELKEGWDEPNKSHPEPEKSWDLVENLKRLDITAPPRWNEYDDYVGTGGQLEYEEWIADIESHATT